MPVLRTRIARRPSPQADPRFKQVDQKLKQGASRVKKHPPARKKAQEAQAAAKGPANERSAGAQANQVDEMQAAETGKPESESFLSILRAEIEKVMPRTMEDATNFMEGGEKEQLKSSVSGNISEQKDQATAGIKQAAQATPDQSGVPVKQVTPIPGEPPAPAPSVDAAQGMPAPRKPAEVSLDQSKKDAEQKMKDEDITSDQLQRANDPRFSAVLTHKSKLDANVQAAPRQYLAAEAQVLNQAARAAQGDSRQGVAAMMGVNSRSRSNVSARQREAQRRDEERRQAVTNRIEAIYNKTKSNVERKLATLETDVLRAFDAGAEAALSAMKSSAKREIDAWYDERYSGLGGPARWLVDKFRDTPPEVKAMLARARTRFLADMDRLVVRIANTVETRLKQAKDEISRGQAEIRNYVASLPRDLQAVGKAAEQEMSKRFDELRQGVDDRRNSLAQKLAERYKAAADRADEALKKMEEEHAGVFAGFIAAIGEVIKILTEFKNKLLAVIREGISVVKLILKDPIGFLSNLIGAIKAGLSQFVGNIWTHLKKGFMAWLFGALASAGIEIPSDLSLPSIFKLVMSVLGLTYERLRAKAVKLIGERNVRILEKLYEYVRTLITQGPAALWAQVQGDLSNLKGMVIDAIQDWIISKVIQAAITKLVSMFNPAGAIVQAIIAIYNTVMFVIERASQIMAFVEAVINSVGSIARGAIGAAANWIEQALARTIPLVIGFLARLVGLGNVSAKIREFIMKVQGAVDRAIDKVLARIVALVKKLFGTGKDGEDPEKQKKLDAGLQALDAVNARYESKAAQKEDIARDAARVKSQHPVFKTLSVEESETGFTYDYTASPGRKKKGPPANRNWNVGLHVVGPPPKLAGAAGDSHHVPAKVLLYWMARLLRIAGVEWGKPHLQAAAASREAVQDGANLSAIWLDKTAHVAAHSSPEPGEVKTLEAEIKKSRKSKLVVRTTAGAISARAQQHTITSTVHRALVGGTGDLSQDEKLEEITQQTTLAKIGGLFTKLFNGMVSAGIALVKRAKLTPKSGWEGDLKSKASSSWSKWLSVPRK
jgi:hypothetical protein